jgi:hypothetical protein
MAEFAVAGVVRRRSSAPAEGTSVKLVLMCASLSRPCRCQSAIDHGLGGIGDLSSGIKSRVFYGSELDVSSRAYI